ncbi:hypothetical protein [Actinomadura sp. J1-007]|uniref:hypothetical protein n=1 Tax=Actinomadura sp. J1-007 TaxID=2661913 RepID=UPI0035CCF452
MRAVSPALAAVHISGDAVYAWGDSTLGHGAIAAYDLGDGERRWRIGENELPADTAAASPASTDRPFSPSERRSYGTRRHPARRRNRCTTSTP